MILRHELTCNAEIIEHTIVSKLVLPSNTESLAALSLLCAELKANSNIIASIMDKAILAVATLNHGFFWMVFFCISCPFTTLYTGLASTDPREYRFYD